MKVKTVEGFKEVPGDGIRTSQYALILRSSVNQQMAFYEKIFTNKIWHSWALRDCDKDETEKIKYTACAVVYV